MATSAAARVATLPGVQATLSYLAPGDGPVEVRVYQPGSGLPNVVPGAVEQQVTIHDGRPVLSQLRLDAEGFELHEQRTRFEDYYDPAQVKQRYYPEVEAVLQELTGAVAVIVFDHNARSAVRAARQEPGVQGPVAQVHNDYTLGSGPRRRQQILEAAGRRELASQPFALINLWRPIIGPVQDNSLAVCDAASVPAADLVPTEIRHYAEGDLREPRHRGEIYSVRHSPGHRWFYFSEMQPDEVLLLKGYDSRDDGRARFVPHTGFAHPAPPSGCVPRESIEARALVVFG